MKSIVGLTALSALLVFCCTVSFAQDQPDSSATPALQSSAVSSPLFINFSCNTSDAKKVSIQWEVDSITEGDYFIIERSNEGGPYESIGALRATVMNTHYDLMDSAPPNGSNFYRIRYADKADRKIYSVVKQVAISGDLVFRFYPNPVDKFLIVRTEHLIDIQVIDAFGSVRLSKRLQKGIQVLDTGSLERGTYILRVIDKESNRVVSNQLLKN
jgi:hypothetical protein